MSVVIDHEMFAAEAMGLRTVGQVLSHLKRANRLVVNLLIDGRAPDLSQFQTVQQSDVHGRTLFIETTKPREMVLEVLEQVEAQLSDADVFKTDAADLLQKNQIPRAMERLGLCFTTWQAAQESVLKTGQLMRIDVDRVRIGDRSMAEVLADFTDQLRQIKQALVNRDFVLLADMLLYETTETNRQWTLLLERMREETETMDND